MIDLNDLVIEAKQANGLGLVLLDACRNNPFASSLSSSLGRAIRGRGLARVESTPTNVLISFATKENNIAPDESQYAKALLKYLPQSHLEVRMLMGSIRDEVMETTGNKQQPHVYGTLGRKAWYLASGSEPKPPVTTDYTTTNPTPTLQAAINPITPPRIAQEETRQFIEPDMVKIQGGTYSIGCLSGKDCEGDETVHKVIVNDFWMAKTEVTVKEYRHCMEAGACQQPVWQETGSDTNIHTGSDNFYKKLGNTLIGDPYPIVGVSWHNALQYAQWLTQKTGKPYRLPTEAEWEIAARGGSKTQYPWGNAIGENKANCSKEYCGDHYQYSSPVASFAAYHGLYDTVGNVWEWTCSASAKNYDGSENKCTNKNDSRSRVLRGGSWGNEPRYVRSANRNWSAATRRDDDVGFRLSRSR